MIANERNAQSGGPRGMLVVLVCISLVFFSLVPASAHKVVIFAWVEGDIVHTESQFAAGKPVKHGEIVVFDPEGHQLLSGTTDDAGLFSFKVPGKKSLRIVLEAGMGHKAEWIVPAEDISGAESPAGDRPAVQELAAPEAAHEEPAAPGTAAVSAGDVRRAMEQVLDRKLAPIQRQLAELGQREPNLRDILGGIGYIFGLVGVALYFHCRRKERRGS